jgi:hypothetical protein
MLKHIVDADYPYTLAVALEWKGGIAQNLDAVAGNNLIDKIGAIPMIVISEDGQDGKLSELLENLRARFGMQCTGKPTGSEERLGDEVTGQNNQVRLQRTCNLNGSFDLWLSDVGAEMKVCHLSDAEAVERFREARKSDGDLLDDGILGFEQEAIERSEGSKAHSACKNLL